MSRFFDPENAGSDKRLHAPATARNRDFILEVMQAHLPTEGTLLELASGTGEHAAYIAPHLKGITWQPTDIVPDNLASIDAWRTHEGAANVLAARKLNVLEDELAAPETAAPLSVIAATNLIHISPWAVAETLAAKAGEALARNGALFLYGPFKRGGAHTAPSNESFDQSLKSRDPDWGVRDLEAVVELATEAGFHEPLIVEMPANNLSLVFRKA